MSLDIFEYQIQLTDSSKFSLDGTPLDPLNVALDIVGGTAQARTRDFGVDGTTIKWDSSSYGLYGVLTTDDIVRVIYDKS